MKFRPRYVTFNKQADILGTLRLVDGADYKVLEERPEYDQYVIDVGISGGAVYHKSFFFNPSGDYAKVEEEEEYTGFDNLVYCGPIVGVHGYAYITVNQLSKEQQIFLDEELLFSDPDRMQHSTFPYLYFDGFIHKWFLSFSKPTGPERKLSFNEIFIEA